MAESGESSGSERRQEDREPVVLVVDYEGVDDLIGDYTENLSTGGTFVHTEREFEIGTEIRLMLSFPGLLRPIAIDGVVRWSRQGDQDERGVGIEFLGGDQGAMERLEEVIHAVRAEDPQYVGRLINVLVVEDNPHVARLIRDGLDHTSSRFGQNLAFSFRMSNNGRDALELLRGEKFHLLIIDIYLPVLDGSAVITEVRADEELKEMPIIAVSAGGQPAREMALAAGANFFLDKPMRLRQIIDSMKKLLALVNR